MSSRTKIVSLACGQVNHLKEKETQDADEEAVSQNGANARLRSCTVLKVSAKIVSEHLKELDRLIKDGYSESDIVVVVSSLPTPAFSLQSSSLMLAVGSRVSFFTYNNIQTPKLFYFIHTQHAGSLWRGCLCE